jgi:hypothetical protein
MFSTSSLPMPVLQSIGVTSAISLPQAETTSAHQEIPDSDILSPTVPQQSDTPPRIHNRSDIVAVGSQYQGNVLASSEEFEQIANDDWEADLFRDESDEEDPSQGPRLSVTTPGPAHLQPEDPQDENHPDPFLWMPSFEGRSALQEPAHPVLAVYLLYMLVAWLHTQFHVPFRACNAILVVFSLALSSMGALLDPPIVTTLPSAMRCLDIEPNFQVLPVCPSCQEVYPSLIPKTSDCVRCGEALFQSDPTPSQQRRGFLTREIPIPRLQFLTKSISEQLIDMLGVPGLEDKMETVYEKISRHQPGEYRNIFDGKVCRELRSADGSLFFHPSEQEKAEGELQIGVTMGVDW